MIGVTRNEKREENGSSSVRAMSVTPSLEAEVAAEVRHEHNLNVNAIAKAHRQRPRFEVDSRMESIWTLKNGRRSSPRIEENLSFM